MSEPSSASTQSLRSSVSVNITRGHSYEDMDKALELLKTYGEAFFVLSGDELAALHLELRERTGHDSVLILAEGAKLEVLRVEEERAPELAAPRSVHRPLAGAPERKADSAPGAISRG